MAKILVVDDEPSMLDVLCTLLRSQGHEVFPYAAGDKAIEMMPHVNPDLIITDIKMRPWAAWRCCVLPSNSIPASPSSS